MTTSRPRLVLALCVAISAGLLVFGQIGDEAADAFADRLFPSGPDGDG